MTIYWQAIQTFLLAILAFIGIGATKYFEEKSKNLATKQHTAEITAKIESIRTQYAKQSLVQKLTFEKEFEILSELWKTLVDLRGQPKVYVQY